MFLGILAALFSQADLSQVLPKSCLEWDRFLGGRLLGYTIRRIADCGPYGCMTECLKRRNCESINYNRETLMCELNYQSITTHLNTSFSQNFKYLTKKEMLQNVIHPCLGFLCGTAETCEVMADGERICIQTECIHQHFDHMTVVDYISATLEIGSVIKYECIRYPLPVELECQIDGSWQPILHSQYHCDYLSQDFLYNAQFNAFFKYVSTPKTHKDAIKYCESFTGGHLFLPLTSAKNRYVQQLIIAGKYSYASAWMDGKIISTEKNVVKTQKGDIALTDFPKQAANLYSKGDTGCFKMTSLGSNILLEYNCDSLDGFLCEISL